ncbi:hypothetical protein BFP70_00950 [Thioclava sp. SK-1]|uniref:hypothetical protein n=1 Tax=Thioclava sp. SK-1 TaxID=1889770 RepID=UPI000824C76C|nr:hypothetical protein [Thioclava sp. SK-1]OCX66756.1 hypothetical protein BFP70_00950 [Thioclava sp. SK-1]
MRLVWWILVCAGCSHSPAPQFWGAQRSEIVLQGIRFAVYDIGGAVEVVRLGWLPRAARDQVPELMRSAAQQASGCTVAGPAAGPLKSPSLPGDTGEARFRMRC